MLAPRGAPVSGRDPSEVALLFPSSGTTGLPKLAVHTHAGFTTFLQTFPLTAAGHIAPHEVVGNVIPFTHIFGTAFLTHACAGARPW